MSEYTATSVGQMRILHSLRVQALEMCEHITVKGRL